MRRVAFVVALFLAWPCVVAAQVVFDNSNAIATTGAATSLTLASFVVSAAGNPVVVVTCVTDDAQTPTATFKAVAMTQVTTVLNVNRATMLQLTGQSGTGDVVCSVGGAATNLVLVVHSFTNANQTTPVRANNTATGSGTAISVVVTSAVNDLVVDGFAFDFTPDTCAQEVPTAPQANKQCATAAGNTSGGAGSTKAGAASVTMAWTQTNAGNWAQIAASIQPPAGGAAVPTRTLLGVGP